MGLIQAVSVRENFRRGLSLARAGIVGELVIGRQLMPLRPGPVNDLWNIAKATAYTMPISVIRLFENPTITGFISGISKRDQMVWFGYSQETLDRILSQDPKFASTGKCGRTAIMFDRFRGLEPDVMITQNTNEAKLVDLIAVMGDQHARWSSGGVEIGDQHDRWSRGGVEFVVDQHDDIVVRLRVETIQAGANKGRQVVLNSDGSMKGWLSGGVVQPIDKYVDDGQDQVLWFGTAKDLQHRKNGLIDWILQRLGK